MWLDYTFPYPIKCCSILSKDEELEGIAIQRNTDIWLITKQILDQIEVEPINYTTQIEDLSSLLFYWRRNKYRVTYISDLKDLPKVNFFLLPKADNFNAAILDYLDKNIYIPKIIYDCANNEEIVDNTGRTLTEIWKQGYRGNRLDIMVDKYIIWFYISETSRVCLAYFEQGKNLSTENLLNTSCKQALILQKNMSRTIVLCKRR